MLRQPTEPAEPRKPANRRKPAESLRLAEPAPRDRGDGEHAGSLASADVGELQAVLFDMDGLIVDSEPLWFEVESAVMARLGGRWGEADQKSLIGGSLPRLTAGNRPPDHSSRIHR